MRVTFERNLYASWNILLVLLESIKHTKNGNTAVDPGQRTRKPVRTHTIKKLHDELKKPRVILRDIAFSTLRLQQKRVDMLPLVNGGGFVYRYDVKVDQAYATVIEVIG